MPTKAPRPTRLPLIDGLAQLERPTVADFIAAAYPYAVCGGVLTIPTWESSAAGRERAPAT